MMDYQNFLVEVDQRGIAVFTVNRPDKMNALDDRSWSELNDLFLWADQEAAVKVIILTGAGGKAFIAGADINALKTKTPIDCLRAAGQKALDRIQHCSKPVIAAVNGYAFGGGCETAIACDFRIVSENAVFGLPETSLGILPGAGGTVRLSRLIGLGRAQDMILMGKTVKAEEAVQIGLASKCVKQEDLMSEARVMAERLLKRGPVGIRLAKQVMQAAFSSSAEVGELLEILSLGVLCSTEDKAEGLSSFLEKRDPEFHGK